MKPSRFTVFERRGARKTSRFTMFRGPGSQKASRFTVSQRFRKERIRPPKKERIQPNWPNTLEVWPNTFEVSLESMGPIMKLLKNLQ